jgi:AraC-like DNA-binding protein/quercetin dioxygenase-like cupin family protein
MEKKISGFTPITLPSILEIDAIVTIHYFEYPKTFTFEGEKHDFWEFLYVDRGEVSVSSNNEEKILKQGQIVFHKPNEFHTVVCNGTISPNLVVISFVSNDKQLDYFRDKVINVGNRAKNMLTTMIDEAKFAFSTDIADPYFKAMILSDSSDELSLSLIKSALQTFLIYLIRQGSGANVNLASSIHIKENKSRVDNIISYLNDNVKNNLNLDMICSDCMMGKSLIQRIFKEQTGWSVMEYYYRLKIERAKLFIKSGEMNFSEIAEELGYSTIHYFSRQFKKIVGMSASEYSRSIDSYRH